jgi:hypothetical protein
MGLFSHGGRLGSSRQCAQNAILGSPHPECPLPKLLTRNADWQPALCGLDIAQDEPEAIPKGLHH